MTNRRQAAIRQARGGERRGAGGAIAPPRLAWWQPLVLLLVVAVAYANSLTGPFVFDDKLAILENHRIQDPTSLDVLFPERELPVAGRPIVNLTFAVNYALDGFAVRGYRLVNVGIHGLCAVLVLGIVRRTLTRTASGEWWAARAPAVAFASAAVWAVHPLNTEAVNYLTQRTELLMALFFLTTLYAAIRAASGGATAWWSTAAIVACAVGMGCKESMVTAPVVVLLYDRVFLFTSIREAWKRRWRLYAGLFAGWAVLAALLSTGPRIHSVGFSLGTSPWTYLLNQASMIVRYLRLSVWPSALVLNYGAPAPVTLGDVWPSATFVVLLVVMTIGALAVRPTVGFLGAFFFITLAPTSSIVPIVTEVGAERRMYLPLLAVVVGLAIAGVGAWSRRGARSAVRVATDGAGGRSLGGVAALAMVLVVLGAVTARRNQDYRSALTLARTTFERWPTAETRHMYGAELSLAGREDEGLRELRASAEGFPRANYNLGISLFQQKEYEEAIAAFDAFNEAFPLLLEVVDARILTGRALAALARWPEAVTAFEDALRMRPSRLDVHGWLADALVAAKREDEAIAHYRRFLAAYPDDADALGSLGVLLFQRDQLAESTALFTRAVELQPANAMARRNLASALLSADDPAGALVQARQAATLAPDDPLTLDLLGMALAAKGLPGEAVLAFRRALQLAPTDEEIQAHLSAAESLGVLPPSRP